MSASTKRKAGLQRKLGTRLYRVLTERREHHNFPVRSSPEVMGFTREFPGVDIDAIHYKLGAVKDLKEIDAIMREAETA